MFIKQMIVGMMGVCCYIVACKKTNQGAIIDPGGNEDEILAACEQENITVKKSLYQGTGMNCFGMACA